MLLNKETIKNAGGKCYKTRHLTDPSWFPKYVDAALKKILSPSGMPNTGLMNMYN